MTRRILLGLIGASQQPRLFTGIARDVACLHRAFATAHKVREAAFREAS